jgi:hypothetical protein
MALFSANQPNLWRGRIWGRQRQSGASAAFSLGEPLDRVNSSGSLATGQPGRRRPATKI